MKDPYARIQEFKGWYPDVDPRDVDEQTFADLVGFDPSRVYGALIKDFGYSDTYASATGTLTGGNTISSSGAMVTASGGTAFLTELQIGSTIIASAQTRTIATISSDTVLTTTAAFSPALSSATSFTFVNPYPTGITILAMKTVYIKALGREFQIMVGKTAGHKLQIWARGYYNGVYTGGWVELTEYFTGIMVSAVGASTITIVVAQEYIPDHFKGFTIVIGGNNILTCTASVRTDATHQTLTIAEDALSITSKRLTPNADVLDGLWVPLTGPDLYAVLDDGDLPTEVPLVPDRDTDVIELGDNETANQCKIGFSDLSGTPHASGYTRLYYRAYMVGGIAGTIPADGTITIDLRESGTSRGAVTRTVKNIHRNPYTEGYVEVVNSTIGVHNNLEAWLIGTTPYNVQLRVSWLKITVDVTEAFGTADLYRFPLMTQMATNYLNVGATPFITMSRSNDKMSIAVTTTAGVVLPPAQVLYINNQYFSSRRSHNSLYLESAMFSKEYVARGIAIDRTGGGVSTFNIIIVPIIDGYQYGDAIFYNETNDLVYNIKVDWGLFNKRVTGFEIYTEWTNLTNLATTDGKRAYFTHFIDITKGDSLWLEDVPKRLYVPYQGVHAYSGATAPDEVTFDSARGAAYTTGAVRYRYHKPMTKRQSSTVAVDDGDNIIRYSFYDAGGVHNDDVFIDATTDLYGHPTMSFLSSPGELMGLAERLGTLYAFKRTSVEVIDLNTFSAAVYPIDCVAKHGIRETAAGIVFLGQNGIYLFPQSGGREEIINRQFLDTYRTISLAKKEAAVVDEIRAINSIIVSIDGVQYIFDYLTRNWWKRKFNHAPVRMSNRVDGQFQFSNGTKIYNYTDRMTYLDDVTGGVEFRIETQWMTHGKPWVQKLLRSLGTVARSTTPNTIYRVEVYVDRNGIVPWDTLEVSAEHPTVTGGDYDATFPIKTPNSYRDLKLVITKKASGVYSDYGMLEFREFRFFGEAGRTGKEG
jgi:hypothetical protein